MHSIMKSDLKFKECIDMNRSKFKNIKTAVCAGFLAAVMLTAAAERNTAESAPKKQMFLFSQFCSSAAADKSGNDKENDGEITYSFKLVEMFEELFG